MVVNVMRMYSAYVVAISFSALLLAFPQLASSELLLRGYTADEFFDPGACDSPLDGRYSVRVGGHIFDIPEDHFQKVIPSELDVTTIGGDGPTTTKRPEANALCRENPIAAPIVIVSTELSGHTFRFILKEDSPPDRIERRRDMLARVRETTHCEPLDEFLMCPVSENSGRERVMYILSGRGPDSLPSGHTFHIRCTESDGRCAIYDDLSETVRVEYGRGGVTPSLGVEGYRALIGHMMGLAKDWMRDPG